MTQIETEIIIKANAKEIWSKLTEFNQYPNWNPFIQSITGKQVIGEVLTVKIVPPNNKPAIFKPVLVKLDDAKELRWVGKLLAGWLFRGEHYFKLVAINDQTTKLIHGEIFTGILSEPLLALIGKNTKAGFELMNNALNKQFSK
ncbi:MAG: SRPBCC domain-containing protein [Gammaproteobacteria bacterium]|nr:SRPBCC domain-containing protein [Gammaproteobacteria bacterium]